MSAADSYPHTLHKAEWLDDGRQVDMEWELAIYGLTEDGVKLGSISHRRNPESWLVVREGDDSGQWVNTKQDALELLTKRGSDERAS